MPNSLALLVSPSTMATARITNPQPTTISVSKPSNSATLISTISRGRRRRRLITCKASPPSSSSSPITEFDLYELLGIDRSSGQPEIKKAYRSMQKRCHPDIAGSVGHDMAIILNEAYALLSDPVSRSAYDKELSKMVDVRGYTGKPVYSTWLGPENEQRAVFVDEVKCVGCLKCALFASQTFAIESAYGRARVVAQWADPEHVIQEAIDACPVDCISMVERSDLPALEFVMSKQPRGKVRIGVGNTVGVRVTDVFTEAQLFQRKLESKNKKHSSAHSMGQDLQRDRTMSAIQAILSISNWLYQRPFNGSPPPGQRGLSLTPRLLLKYPSEPRIDKLRMAAAARKEGKFGLGGSRTAPSQLYADEYWVPTTPNLPPGGSDTSRLAESSYKGSKRKYEENRQSNVKQKRQYERKRPRPRPLWGIPAGASAIAAMAVGLQGGTVNVGGVTEHVAGPLALEIVNSLWLQVALAGATWYIAGFTIVRTIQALGRYGTQRNS